MAVSILYPCVGEAVVRGGLREIGSGGCVPRISGDPTRRLDFRGSHFAILHPCEGEAVFL